MAHRLAGVSPEHVDAEPREERERPHESYDLDPGRADGVHQRRVARRAPCEHPLGLRPQADADVTALAQTTALYRLDLHRGGEAGTNRSCTEMFLIKNRGS